MNNTTNKWNANLGVKDEPAALCFALCMIFLNDVKFSFVCGGILFDFTPKDSESVCRH